jgi:non-specific serine/threonine protein kinase
VARYQGDYRQALDLEHEGLALARASGDQWGIAHALKNLSRAHLFLGHHRQAKMDCEASLALFRELGGTWGTHFCLEVLAALEGAANQPARAARLLGAADGLRERFGLALAPAERVEYLRIEATAVGGAGQEWFAAARAEGHAMPLSDSVAYALSPPEPAAAPSSGQMPLSKREREVVELIGRGLSNREIGEVLVVTERTAEAHVTHVLQKLGLRSRAQVAIWAVERGLIRSHQAV